MHIDPRFTRTSALADTYVPLRAGADIAFLGGVINYILSNEQGLPRVRHRVHQRLVHRQRGVQGHRRARRAVLGLRRRARRLRPGSWAYEGFEGSDTTAARGERARQGPRLGAAARVRRPEARGAGARAPTRTRPCRTRAASSRSSSGTTPGTPPRWCSRSAASRPSCSCGSARSGRATRAASAPPPWSTRSAGRSTASASSTSGRRPIIQLLLGNMGRPGGGIMAMRGHASIQGSTDIPTLFNILPGYMPMPSALTHTSLEKYLDSFIGDKQKGFWRNADAYFISLMKEYWGDAARKDNDYGYDWLPRLTGDHGTYRTIDGHGRRQGYGYFLLGQNPAVGSRNGKPAAARRWPTSTGSSSATWHDRERHLLEGLARDRDRRDRPAGVPHRGLLLPGGRAHREGGHLHPDAADAAVAREGRRAQGRPALGALVLLPPRPRAEGGVEGLHRRARQAAAGR